MQDWPYNSSSVGGGNVRSYTIGANYSANRSRAVRVLNDSSINTCFRFLNHKGNRTEDKTTVRKEIN